MDNKVDSKVNFPWCKIIIFHIHTPVISSAVQNSPHTQYLGACLKVDKPVSEETQI